MGGQRQGFFREVREEHDVEDFLFVNFKMTHFFLFETTIDRRQQLPALQVQMWWSP